MAQDILAKKLANHEEVTFCKEEAQLQNVTAKAVALAAQKGDAAALKILRVSGEALGKGLAVLIDLLNPEKIVIGSIYARNEALFRQFMMKPLRKEALARSVAVCEIVPALLGEKIGDVACLTVAMEMARENEEG